MFKRRYAQLRDSLANDLDAYDCGISLASYINPDITHKLARLDEIAEELMFLKDQIYG